MAAKDSGSDVPSVHGGRGEVRLGSGMLEPRLVDFGKARSKEIRALKEGRGKLRQELADVLTEVEAGLGDATAGKVILPLIVVVEKKKKRKGLFGM